MKKYIKPQMTNIVINNDTIMAGSFGPKDEVGNKIVLGKENTIDEWDFDEED